MTEQEVKAKKLVFQDIDMFQNSILNPSSIESIEKDPNDETIIKVAKVSMSPNSINSEADSISLKNNDNNYISLDKTNNTVDIVTNDVGITGTTTINEKMVVGSESCNISNMNVSIDSSNNNVKITGKNGLSIESGDNNSSEIASTYLNATKESRSKQFLVNEKVYITCDDTGSLLFIQKED